MQELFCAFPSWYIIEYFEWKKFDLKKNHIK
jgi:hypothetical protein